MRAPSTRRAPWLAGAALLAGFAAAAHAAPVESADRLTREALALPARPEHGAALFDAYCSRCHGDGARGDPEQVVPALAGQRIPYLIRQLADFLAGERDSRTMHAIVDQPDLRSPQAWSDLAAYLNREPALPAPETGDGRQVALGRGIYREQCASCHRADARGSDRGFVPSLRSQHYGYLVRQLHKLADYRRHNMDIGLVKFMQSFDDRDIQAVADYLARLGATARSAG